MKPVTTTAQQAAFIAERVLAIKRELLNAFILSPITGSDGNTMPLTVDSFGALHDYCDANTLGGLCDDDVTAKGNALFPERTDDETIASQGWMDACNTIQTAVHEWLAVRDSARDASFLACYLNTEQATCFLSDWRAYEAHAMLDDLHARAGYSVPATARLRSLLPAAPNWTREFPVMAQAQGGDLGVYLPFGWEDHSWHNDTNPSFRVPALHLNLWVSDADPGERELGPESGRFTLVRYHEEHSEEDLLVECDDAETIYMVLRSMGAPAPAGPGLPLGHPLHDVVVSHLNAIATMKKEG